MYSQEGGPLANPSDMSSVRQSELRQSLGPWPSHQPLELCLLSQIRTLYFTPDQNESKKYLFPAPRMPIESNVTSKLTTLSPPLIGTFLYNKWTDIIFLLKSKNILTTWLRMCRGLRSTNLLSWLVWTWVNFRAVRYNFESSTVLLYSAGFNSPRD